MNLKQWFNKSKYKYYDIFKRRLEPLKWDKLTSEQRKDLTQLTEYKQDKAKLRVESWKSCKTLQDVIIEVNLIQNISTLSLFRSMLTINGVDSIFKDRANYLGAYDYIVK